MTLLSAASVQADNFNRPMLTPSASDFGGVGLIQMPNARFEQEGELTVGSTYNDDYWHFNLSLQVLPWLETTLRYTIVNKVLYNTNFAYSGDTRFTDKSIDIKARIWEESYWTPDIAIGLRDLGGSGLFDGEYIATSKRWGHFDFTLGLGWGYIGNSGNLHRRSNANNEKCQRQSDYDPQGGSIESHRWFSGCMSIFGGIEYQTPWSPLRIKLEYDSNDYLNDRPVLKGKDRMPQDSHFNIGLLYRIQHWGNIRLSYERGNTLTAGFDFFTNFNQISSSWQETPAPRYQENETTRSAPYLTDAEWRALHQQLQDVAGYDVDTLMINEKEVTLVANQNHYRDLNIAHYRAATLLHNQGLQTKQYRFIEKSTPFLLTETTLDTAIFSDVAQYHYPNAHIQDAIIISEPITLPISNSTHQFNSHASSWQASLSPNMQQSFGGPEGFYLYHFGVNGNAGVNIGEHWNLGGSIYVNLLNNYHKFNYDVPPDGTHIPRVRMLIRQYLKDTVRFSNLQLTGFTQWQDNWFGEIYGGYLESMFAGIGGEVLYRPLNQSWALGMDLNYVIQRKANSALGLFKHRNQYDPITQRPYQVQTGTVTGHASLYYQPTWSWLDNTLLTISVGQYLAEDRGITLDFAKQFDSGIIAGVFATLTNLSAKEYGEGSYTKGLYVSIPFDILTIKPSTQRAYLNWTPLTRDGGQALNRKYPLYSMTDARSPWYTRPPKTSTSSNAFVNQHSH